MQLRVYLIDDNQRIRDLVKDVLEERGHQVFAFSEPFRCPILLNDKCECPEGRQCGDIFITDLEMPGMSGLDFIENQVRFGCRGLTSTTAVMSEEGSGETGLGVWLKKRFWIPPAIPGRPPNPGLKETPRAPLKLLNREASIAPSSSGKRRSC